MINKQSLRTLIVALFPHPVLVGHEELDQLVEQLARDDEFCQSNAALVESIACASQGQEEDGVFVAAESAIEEALADARASQMRMCISRVYELLASCQWLFESMFARRLTDGNEPCPYWRTYHDPPGPA